MLDALHARIAPQLRRAEARARVGRSVAGLLGVVERKNGWQLAKYLARRGHRECSASSTAPIGTRTPLHDDPAGGCIVDETGFLEAGYHVGGRGAAVPGHSG